METAEILTKISLPKKYSSNKFVMIDKFADEARNYLSYLSKWDEPSLGEDKNRKVIKSRRTVIETAQKISDDLQEVFKSYESADSKHVQELIDDLMNQLKDDLFIGIIGDWVKVVYKGEQKYVGLRITRGHEFYRVRPVESKTDFNEKNPDELFHIPLDKRAYSSNERFSLAGFPSLYLSTMLPLAWQECGYPKRYYYSRYKYNANPNKTESTAELNVLMIYSPTEIRNWGEFEKRASFDFWLEMITRYLKTYPLILACSFINQSGNVPYKQEYIVPQLLMQWVQRNNSKIQGIEYFSCVDMQTQPIRWCAYNIAIPALKPFDKKGYSKYLREKFEWTKPTYYALPIFETSETESDREFLYNIAELINNVMQTHLISEKYLLALCTMANMVGCMMSLMEKPEASDAHLTLNMLEMLSNNANYLKQQNLMQSIEENIKSDNYPMSDDEVMDVSKAFSKVYFLVISETVKTITVESIIDKYKKSCWNAFPD